MKKLISLKEFKQKNPETCLDLNQLNTVSGGQGTWQSETHGTTDSDYNGWDIK